MPIDNGDPRWPALKFGDILKIDITFGRINVEALVFASTRIFACGGFNGGVNFVLCRYIMMAQDGRR